VIRRAIFLKSQTFLKVFHPWAQDLAPKGKKSCAQGRKILRLQELTGKAVLSSRLPGTFIPPSRHLHPAFPALSSRTPGIFIPHPRHLHPAPPASFKCRIECYIKDKQPFFAIQRKKNLLLKRFQEEAKASSQRATAMFFRRAALSVQCRRHLLMNSFPLELLCVLSVLCVENFTNLFFYHYLLSILSG